MQYAILSLWSRLWSRGCRAACRGTAIASAILLCAAVTHAQPTPERQIAAYVRRQLELVAQPGHRGLLALSVLAPEISSWQLLTARAT